MERPDIRHVATELNSTAIHLVRRVRRADASLGVPPARLSALSVLVFGGPRTLSELADAEQVTVPTMSGVVRGLEETGLAQRSAHPTDRRATVVSATAKGRKLMLRGRDQRVDQLVERLRGLNDRDLTALERATEVLRRLEADDR
jgi:DNA-binding MarR family transcriptional regulator